MMHRFGLWLLLFHIGFFITQMIWPITTNTPLLWLATMSGVLLIVPWSRDFIERRVQELAVLNIVLVLLQIIWLATGVNHSILSFIGLGLVGVATALWNVVHKRKIDVEKLNLPYMSIVFAMAFIVLSKSLDLYCRSKLATDFDSQNYLTWAFTAYKNYLPYLDIVYWYGLFSYYSASIPGLKVLMVFWSLLLFMLIALAGAALIKNKVLLSFFLMLCATLIEFVGGYEAFFRYGTSFAFSIASAYLLSRKIISRLGLILLGLGAAGMVFLISDQGIYFSLIIAAQIFLRCVFVDRLAFKKTVWLLMERYFWFTAGFAVMLAVAGIGMAKAGVLYGYLENMRALGMMGVFAKVELARLLFSKENIFTSVVLLLGTLYFVQQSFFAKTKINGFNFLLNAGLLIAIWLCQNKFLVRPWFEIQFVLFSFIFFSFQVAQIIDGISEKVLSKANKNLLVFALITICFGSLVPDKAGLGLLLSSKEHYSGKYARLIQEPGFSKTVTTCLSDYFDNFNQYVPQKYTDVFNWIATQTGGERAQIFSFPGEPIFYLRNNQMPPAYFNAYDATALAAQQKNIRYIEEHKVRFIIWDTDSSMIQDNVPDIMRNNLVAHFILTQFEAKQQVGNFLIFERTASPSAFLTNKLIKTNASFYDALTTFNLKFYPVLLHRKMQSKPKQVLHHFTQNTELLLQAHNKPEELYLRISTKQNTPVELDLTTKTGLKTKLMMTSCFTAKPCLIPLDQLPIFFNPVGSAGITITTVGDWETELVLATP